MSSALLLLFLSCALKGRGQCALICKFAVLLLVKSGLKQRLSIGIKSKYKQCLNYFTVSVSDGLPYLEKSSVSIKIQQRLPLILKGVHA